MISINELSMGSKRFFGNYCGSNKINSPGPRKSIETNFSRNRFSRRKKPLARFFSFYQMWPASKDILKGSTSYSDNYCRAYESNFLGPERLWKTKISGKRAKFPLKKILWPFFLVASNITIVLKQFYIGPEGSLTIIVQIRDDHFLRTWNSRTKLFKKSQLPGDKSFWPTFFSFYRVCQTPGDNL